MSKKNSKVPEISDQERRKAQLKQIKKNDPSIIKEQIFRFKQQLQDLLKKKNELEQDIQKNQDQNVAETYKIEISLKNEQQKCIAYENQLAELKSTYQKQIINLKKSKDIELEQFTKKKHQQKQLIKQQRIIYQEKLDYLKKYPQRLTKYKKSVESLDNQILKMQKSQQKDLNNIKNQHELNRKQLQSNTKEELQKIKSTQVAKLEKKMMKDQFIKKENQVMEKQINLCEEQKSALEIQFREMSSHIQGQKSKDYDNVLESQAGETYQRSLRIIKLQGKLAKLKAYLSEQSTKMEKQYEGLDTFYTKQSQELEAKISKAEGWIRMKQRDLKKVKACSQMVLNQRSNLECYLLQVFYEHPQLDYRSQQQISQVLRHLFAKINSKKPPMTYKHYLIESQNTITSNSSKI